MADNYRIKEQFGFFYIEKQVDIKIEDRSSLLCLLFYPFVKPKVTIKRVWYVLGSEGKLSNLFNSPLKFTTKSNAEKAIKDLEPKYHNI